MDGVSTCVCPPGLEGDTGILLTPLWLIPLGQALSLTLDLQLVDTKPCLHTVYICYTTGVTDLYGHTQLFIWVLGSKFASSFLHSKLLCVYMCTHKDYTFSQIVEIGFLRGHKENN